MDDTRMLKITVGTSRGRETYGYNIVTLTDTKTGKKYRTCGGGYDMTGTVLAEWMGDVLQPALKALLESQGFEPGGYAGPYDAAKEAGRQYGAGISKKGVAYMDGACGQNTVQALLGKLGYSCQTVGWEKPRGYHFDGFLVWPTTDEEAKEKDTIFAHTKLYEGGGFG